MKAKVQEEQKVAAKPAQPPKGRGKEPTKQMAAWLVEEKKLRQELLKQDKETPGQFKERLKGQPLQRQEELILEKGRRMHFETPCEDRDLVLDEVGEANMARAAGLSYFV